MRGKDVGRVEERCVNGLRRVYLVISTLSLVGIIVCVLLQIIFRYLFGSPLPWSEQVSLFLFCWSTYAGSAAVSAEGSHIEVDFFTSRLPEASRRILYRLLEVMILLFSLLIASIGLFAMRQQGGMRMVATGLPLSWYTLAIVLGFFGISLFCLKALFRGLCRTGADR